jgi:hypothetical protein
MLSWILAGTKYALDDGVYCWHHGDSGIGTPPMHRLEERGPLQHGVTDLGFRLDPRVIQLILGLEAGNQALLYAKRAALAGIFPPGASGSLVWEMGGLTRQIDGHLMEGMDFSSQDRVGLWQRTAVVIKCADPTWYDPAGKALTFELGGGGTGTPVPTPVPTSVGASTINSNIPINYAGNWMSYPHLIRLIGPMTNPEINNLTTGETLPFTGTIAAGHYYDIDLRYGHKTVVDELGVNKVSTLAAGHDLATWHIAAHPEALGGVNVIEVVASAVNEQSAVQISWLDRYLTPGG